MTILCMIVSLGMLVVINAAYRRGLATTTGVLAVMFLFVMCLASITLGLNWLLLTGVVIGCLACRSSAKRFGMYSLCATALAYVALVPGAISRSREVADLRQRYPVESLSERLAYEKKQERKSRQEAALKLASENENTKDSENGFVAALEEKVTAQTWIPNADLRHRSLPSLYEAHHGFVAEFVNADGFGFVRTGRMPARREYIDLPETAPIPLPKYEPPPAGLSAADQAAPAADVPAPGGKVPGTPLLAELHQNGVVDFVNPAGFGYMPYRQEGAGYVKGLDQVGGFQAHAFRAMPEWPAQQGVRWRIVMLQLVSLLKHPTPVAYLSNNLPRMDELRAAKTRPLDEFELGALTRLEAGEDVIVVEGTNTISMLGSIRALKQCTECHQVERGTLLGAFSYRLSRDPKLPKPAPKKTTPKALSRLHSNETVVSSVASNDSDGLP